MNKTRRAALGILQDRLIALHLEDVETELNSIGEDLQAIIDEEQESYDNLPESLQGGDREATLDSLNAAMENIEEIANSISNNGPVSNIDDAKGQA